MAHAGAKGATAESMSKGLFLPSDLEVARQGFQELIQKLTVSYLFQADLFHEID
jgi:serine protease inhibitor